MELAAARKEGFHSKSSIDTDDNNSKRRPLVVIGIFTRFGRRNNRDAIRKAWMGNGKLLFLSVALLYFSAGKENYWIITVSFSVLPKLARFMGI